MLLDFVVRAYLNDHRSEQTSLREVSDIFDRNCVRLYQQEVRRCQDTRTRVNPREKPCHRQLEPQRASTCVHISIGAQFLACIAPQQSDAPACTQAHGSMHQSYGAAMTHTGALYIYPVDQTAMYLT